MYKRPEFSHGQTLAGQHDQYVVDIESSPRYAPRGGANGLVHRARTKSTGAFVAVKLFSPRDKPDPTQWRRPLRDFKNEIKTTQFIRHWNLVALLDWGKISVDGQVLTFSVMEFIEADLEQSVGKQTSLSSRLFCCSQLCDAAAYFNARGFLHRDIKPANILVTPSGLVKLGDLGLSVILPDLERREAEHLDLYSVRMDYGMPRHHFSPEQLELVKYLKEHPDARLSPKKVLKAVDLSRSDIYQVGKVCHEILTGINPTAEQDPTSNCYADTPRHLIAVLRSMLSQNSSKRPPLDHVAWVFFMTLAQHLSTVEQSCRRLTRECKRLLKAFASRDTKSVTADELRTYHYQSPLRYLAKRQLIRLVVPSERASHIGLPEEIRVRFDVAEGPLRFELTPKGIDLRNRLTVNADWRKLQELYAIIGKQPTPNSIAYISKAFKPQPPEWYRKKPPWFLDRTSRMIHEFSMLDAHPKEDGSYYVFKPFTIDARWYLEVQTSRSLDRKRPRPGIFHWGSGYDAPWLVLDGHEPADLFAEARKVFSRMDISLAKIRKAFCHPDLRPGRQLFVSPNRLMSHTFWDRLLADNGGVRACLRFDRSPAPLSPFILLDILSSRRTPGGMTSLTLAHLVAASGVSFAAKPRQGDSPLHKPVPLNRDDLELVAPFFYTLSRISPVTCLLTVSPRGLAIRFACEKGAFDKLAEGQALQAAVTEVLHGNSRRADRLLAFRSQVRRGRLNLE